MTVIYGKKSYDEHPVFGDSSCLDFAAACLPELLQQLQGEMSVSELTTKIRESHFLARYLRLYGRKILYDRGGI
jgi:hypothetical protein